MRGFQTRRLLSYLVPVAALCASWTLGATGAPAQTLKTIKERGSLICGINPGLLGFSLRDDRGSWTGLDVDFCRALSAAIFDDPGKIQLSRSKLRTA